MGKGFVKEWDDIQKLIIESTGCQVGVNSNV